MDVTAVFKTEFRGGVFKDHDHIDRFNIPIGKIMRGMAMWFFYFDILTKKQIRCVAGHSFTWEIVSLFLNFYIDNGTIFRSCDQIHDKVAFAIHQSIFHGKNFNNCNLNTQNTGYKIRKSILMIVWIENKFEKGIIGERERFLTN